MRTVHALALVFSLCGLASAEEALRPRDSSRPDFAPTRVSDGRTLVITGSGEVKGEYQMALYIDEIDARRAFAALAARAGGRSKAKLMAADHSQSFVVWGHFTKIAVLHALKAYDANALRAIFKDALVDAKADAFLALIDKDLPEGSDLTLRTYDDGRIELDIDGEKRAPPQSAKLARALWKVWLADKPAQPELRRSLIEKIELLGR
jgi:hypothetical protein